MEAQDLVRGLIEDKLHQALVFAHGQGLAVAGEVEHTNTHILALGPSLFLRETHHSRLRIAVDTGGNAI